MYCIRKPITHFQRDSRQCQTEYIRTICHALSPPVQLLVHVHFNNGMQVIRVHRVFSTSRHGGLQKSVITLRLQ